MKRAREDTLITYNLIQSETMSQLHIELDILIRNLSHLRIISPTFLSFLFDF